jgi:DNA-binding HxlR family transcriptional regulator
LPRSYKTQEGCPVAGMLDLLGDRWTLLVLRDLIAGRANRFKDLLESLQGISPNLLAQRLKRLEQQGIVKRVFYCDHPPRAEYHLTGKGEDLRPVLKAMADWGVKYDLADERRANHAAQEHLAIFDA